MHPVDYNKREKAGLSSERGTALAGSHMKRRAILSGVLLAAFLQASSVPAAEEQEPKKWMAGTEVDVIRLLQGRHYASAVAGYDNWRLRLVYSRASVDQPKENPGFRNNEYRNKLVIVERYFERGFKGWWLSAGMGSRDGIVTEWITGITKRYRTSLFTLGVGYTFRFNDYLSVTPGFAFSLPMRGDSVQFATGTFEIGASTVTSLRVGVNF